MKTKKRLLSTALSILSAVTISAFSFSSFTAYAEDPTYSITVMNPLIGEKYNVYKVFDLTYSENGKKYNYAYTVSDEWKSFFNDTSDKGGAQFITVTGGNVTDITDKNAAALAEFIMANKIYSGKTKADEEITAVSGSSVKFEFADPGYYLVVSSVGNCAMLDTTPGEPDPQWGEKNKQPTLKKKLASADTDNVAIGDTIAYSVDIKAQKGAKNYVFMDTMPKGLTLVPDSITVSDLTAKTDYTVDTASGTNYTFRIIFDQDYLDTITEEKNITIKYSATVNGDAYDKNSSLTNKATMTFGDQSSVTASSVTSETSEFQLLKYKNGDEAKKPLAGAKFQLYDGGNTPVDLVKLSGTEYRLALSGETATQDIVTVESDAITIYGLDCDGVKVEGQTALAPRYTLKEIAAPKGYNLLVDPVEIEFSADGSETVIEIPNSAGTELPETGGKGTAILLTVGGVLFVGLGVVLVTKKRLYNEG